MLIHITESLLKKDLKTTISLPLLAKEQVNLEMKEELIIQLVFFMTISVNTNKLLSSTKSSYKFAKPLEMFMEKLCLTIVLELIT